MGAPKELLLGQVAIGILVELIEPFLEREGVEVELLANGVHARPEGWEVHIRDRAVCTVCGESCKRSSLPHGEVAYVGDGYSDRCAALVATRVFATGGLAQWLHGRGVAFDSFEDFYEVLAALDAPRPARLT